MPVATTTASPSETTGSNVKAEMARRSISQAQLAQALGLSQTGISARIRGVTPFDVNELIAAAAFLDVPVERLLEGVTPATQIA